MLCGFERRACKHRGWVCAFGLVLLGRSFRGSFFCSCFRSFFSWFVLLVVLRVRASGRSFCGSFFWFVLLGARMCFLFDALKVLEACVARSEVS